MIINRICFFVLFAILYASSSMFSQQVNHPPELQSLLDKKEQAESEIKKTFVIELSKLKSKYTQQGKLEEAILVENLIKINDSNINKAVYLDDLNGFNVKVGYGRIGLHGTDGEKRPILVNKIVPKHSIFLHPPTNGSSTVSYRLNRSYSVFEGKATLVDNAMSRTPLIFRVLADNVPLWESGKIQSSKNGQNFSVNIKDAEIITLEVICQGAYTNAWAVWVEPNLQP